MKFYVYYYIGETGLPYYVGKGCGRRAFSRHRYTEVPPADRVVFYHNLGEDFALEMEERLITLFGLKKDGGLLENKMRKGVKNCPQDPIRVSQEPVALPPLNQMGGGFLEPDHTPRSTKRLAKRGPKVPKVTEVLGMEFPSVSAAGRYFGVDRGTLRRFLSGHTSCQMKCTTAKEVQCGDHRYLSIRDAAKAFQMDKGAVKWRIESHHWKDWKWVTK